MTVPLILVANAVAVAAVAAPLLARASWVERAPRLALALWQTLTASVVASAALAGGALAVPVLPLTADTAELLWACLMILRDTYSTVGGGITATAGMAVAAAVAGRCAHGLGSEWTRALRERRRHLEVLAVVGTGDVRSGATVVDHGASAAYCLPGRGGHVVLTSAALAALDDAGLRAVLAHERAHLRGRHHLLLVLARGVERAFPFVPAFELARSETARLVELAADDAAAAATDRLTVAGALLALNSSGTRSPVSESALAAGGRGTGHRVRRLIDGRALLGTRGVVLGGATAVVVAVLPFAVGLAPVFAMVGAHCCPLF